MQSLYQQKWWSRAGAQSLKNGTETLKSSSSEISGLMEKIGTLKTGLTSVKNGTETLKMVFQP